MSFSMVTAEALRTIASVEERITAPGRVETLAVAIDSFGCLAGARQPVLHLRGGCGWVSVPRLGKHADPDIPILKEAKAEYAKLL
jgi:hypothetical protein